MDQLTQSFLATPYRSSSMPTLGQVDEDKEISANSEDKIEKVSLKQRLKDKFHMKSRLDTGRESSPAKMIKVSSEKDMQPRLDNKAVTWNCANPKSKEQFQFSKSTETTEIKVDESPKTPRLKSKKKISLGESKVIEETHLSSLCLEGLPLGKLGVVEHKAYPSLHTKAFHKLELSKLCSFIDCHLAEMRLNFSNSNHLILESKTLRDSTTDESSSHDSTPNNVLLPLLNLQVQREQSSLLGGAFVNNYPAQSGGGQINCDFFHGELHPDYMFSLIADGCNWGSIVRLAAQRAVCSATQFVNQMLTHSSQPVKTAENLAWVLIQSMAMAHEAIVKGYREPHSIGTTTLNICFVFMTSENKKYLMVAGVGDCKVFLANETSENHYTVSQVECSKRSNFKASDPGGRLGPYVGENYTDPDLRNLSINCIPLPEGKSIIFNTTDGIHDNLDPEKLGKEPTELETTLPSSTKWSDLPVDKRQEMVVRYQNELFERLINEAITKKIDEDLDNLCKAITDYCHQITAYGRDFMESNPSKKEPENKKLNPGKMDHCSIIALIV